ncbi:hypothetical protein E2N92_00515 [Methanofollis formosanus]|uniref:Uncharacterized protein n=1 Tax=Methanofollis formosanus TaxID=299308 RepID=A0A8G1EFC1_9EURY|nr:hypothetical protein E2N92_00515 [Methanofollis formosanus]
MNMESIPVLVGIFLIFGVPLLLFAAYTTVLSYLIRKIPNPAVRILAPLGIALLFLFVELDNPFLSFKRWPSSCRFRSSKAICRQREKESRSLSVQL